MRKLVLILMLFSIIGLGVGEEVAPEPDDSEIREELNEHWTEQILPDLIDSISERFDSIELGVPSK